MTMRRLILTLLAACAALSAGAQVYVATDKSCYVAGERIWCSAFAGACEPVAYLELASSEGVSARGRIALQDGRGGGSLRIPFGTPTGNYRLRCYTAGAKEAGGPVISVFNTLSTTRVNDGVEVVQALDTAHAMQTGYGLAAETGGSVVLENTSGQTVSLCVSLCRDDSLQPPAWHSISSFEAPPAAGANPGGETVRAYLAGADAAIVAARAEENFTDAIIAVPGAKTDCCVAYPEPDGSFEFHTENIYGDCDLVCLLRGVPEGMDCHLELSQPFIGGAEKGLPKLRISTAQAQDLERRTAAMLAGAGRDSLAVTLPMAQDHFLLTHECISYILDDYTRFPTMEELFVEITPNIKMRKRGGKTHIYLVKATSVTDAAPRWGSALTMIDGVPVPDQDLIAGYDPALIKVVETYPYSYSLGGRSFDGVINFVTFKGNMPGVLFDDNIRIYSFPGCSLPEVHEGTETLFWHPLVRLQPGEKVAVPATALQKGERYMLSAEGLTDEGRPVWLRKTVVFLTY